MVIACPRRRYGTISLTLQIQRKLSAQSTRQKEVAPKVEIGFCKAQVVLFRYFGVVAVNTENDAPDFFRKQCNVPFFLPIRIPVTHTAGTESPFYPVLSGYRRI